MSSETPERGSEGKQASRVGRTVWDFFADVLSSRLMWAVICVLTLATLTLASLDLLSLRYDDGVRFRLGPDPELIRQAAQKRESEREQESRVRNRKEVFAGLVGRWIGFLTYVENNNTSNITCEWKIVSQYEVRFLDFNSEHNLGRARLLLDKTITLNFNYKGSNAVDRVQAECMDDAGVRVVGANSWKYSYDINFSVQNLNSSDQKLDAKLTQIDCYSSCHQFSTSIELIHEKAILFHDGNKSVRLTDG